MIKVLRLPNPAGIKGYDLSDFFQSYQDKEEAAERLSIMIDGSKEWQPGDEKPEEKPEGPKPEEKKPLIQFEDVTNWLLEDPPPIEWVYDETMARGIVGCLVAQGGTGKTYFLEAGVMASIIGVEYFRLLRPVRPLRVIACIVEDPANITRGRIFDIGQTLLGNGITKTDVQSAMNDNLRLLCSPIGPLSRYDGKGNPEPTEAFGWLLDQVEKFNPDVIVLDPKAQLYGLDENNNDHNTAWVNQLKLLNAGGATTLFAHHTPKNVSAFNLGGMRGGGGLADACRWVMGMQHLEPETARQYGMDDASGYVHARMTKNSYAALDQADIFFQRGSGGELLRVDLRSQQIDGLGELIVKGVADHYAAGGSDLTKRDIVRDSAGENIREQIQRAFPHIGRPTLERVIEDCFLRKTLKTITTKRGHKTIRAIRLGDENA